MASLMSWNVSPRNIKRAGLFARERLSMISSHSRSPSLTPNSIHTPRVVGNRIAFFLEGGYNPPVVASTVVAMCRTMEALSAPAQSPTGSSASVASVESASESPTETDDIRRSVSRVIAELASVHAFS